MVMDSVRGAVHRNGAPSPKGSRGAFCPVLCSTNARIPFRQAKNGYPTPKHPPTHQQNHPLTPTHQPVHLPPSPNPLTQHANKAHRTPVPRPGSGTWRPCSAPRAPTAARGPCCTYWVWSPPGNLSPSTPRRKNKKVTHTILYA